MPLPFSLVVKNGSKMRDCVSLSMPMPVSLTDEHDVVAGADELSARGDGSHPSTMFWVWMVSLPPAGHRILGIDHQIHEHLFELAGVGAGVSGFRSKSR